MHGMSTVICDKLTSSLCNVITIATEYSTEKNVASLMKNSKDQLGRFLLVKRMKGSDALYNFQN